MMLLSTKTLCVLVVVDFLVSTEMVICANTLFLTKILNNRITERNIINRVKLNNKSFNIRVRFDSCIYRPQEWLDIGNHRNNYSLWYGSLWSFWPMNKFVTPFYQYPKESNWVKHFRHHIEITFLDPFPSNIIYFNQVTGFNGNPPHPPVPPKLCFESLWWISHHSKNGIETLLNWIILPHLLYVLNICVAQGPQRPTPRNGLLSQGGEKEAVPPVGVGGTCGYRDGGNIIRGTPSTRSHPSSTLGEYSWRWNMTGQRWSTTFLGHNISGSRCPRCWARMVQMPGTWEEFTWRWFRRFFCTGQRRGLWHRTLGGFWADSTTRWPADWQDNNLGEVGTVGGFTPRWMKRWWRRYYRRWRTKSPATRTQSHSSLQPGPLWTCVWRWSGVLGQGWPSSGGNRTAWTWTGCRRRIRRRNVRREMRIWTGRWQIYNKYVGGYCSKRNIREGS